jgi:hypothetical protein
MPAADRINDRIALDHTVQYQSPVESLPPMTFPVERAYVVIRARIDDSSIHAPDLLRLVREAA